MARPSSPSVRLTALEEPIITNNPNGIKETHLPIKFKKGKYKLNK